MKWTIKNGKLIQKMERVPDYSGLPKPSPEEIERFAKAFLEANKTIPKSK